MDRVRKVAFRHCDENKSLILWKALLRARGSLVLGVLFCGNQGLLSEW